MRKRDCTPKKPVRQVHNSSEINKSEQVTLEGYTERKIEPAKNYDVVSFARAMNSDFGSKVKELFEVEKKAALEATESGLYISWRCPEFKNDCQRVASSSKCFCGHKLDEHKLNSKKTQSTPCTVKDCTCKIYSWIPSRPEEIGEFWHRRRKDFDIDKWRVACKCKHNHEEHDPRGMRRCKKCSCFAFKSNFLCAACDKHWEDHETFIETADERKEQGLPIGSEFMPFSEIPSLRNMVLTGVDDGDTSYILNHTKNELTDGKPPPPSSSTTTNDHNKV